MSHYSKNQVDSVYQHAQLQISKQANTNSLLINKQKFNIQQLSTKMSQRRKMHQRMVETQKAYDKEFNAKHHKGLKPSQHPQDSDSDSSAVDKVFKNTELRTSKHGDLKAL